MTATDRPGPGPVLRRIALVSMHTSPLERPGTGDAGGLNVYCEQTATRLARRGIEVDIYTRATSTGQGVAQLAPGVRVHHLVAGGPTLAKEDLPDQLDTFTDQLAAQVATHRGHYDLLHSHYWLSGQVGAQVSARFDVPLVHTMHTMARVKNLALAPGESPEPPARERGEVRVVAEADALVANTEQEARQLIELYDAAPEKVHITWPGVALETFRPGDQGTARAALGLPADAVLLLFVGRIQPLKAPDVLIRAAGELVRQDPGLRRRLVVAVLGGPSGSGLARPRALAQLARDEGLADVVCFTPPVSREELADWYRAVDLVTVPSHNESFGLVALEALACGTPVVAARVGGLPVAVGKAGVLVDGHDPADWAEAISATLDRLERPGERRVAADRAVQHARSFSWEHTVDRLVEVYTDVSIARRTGRAQNPSGAT